MYPCKVCLITSCCTELCDTILKRNRKESAKMIIKEICPDCGSKIIKSTHFSEYSWEVECDYCNHTFCMGGGENLLKRIIR